MLMNYEHLVEHGKYHPLLTATSSLLLDTITFTSNISGRGISNILSGYQSKITTFKNPIVYTNNTLSFDNSVNKNNYYGQSASNG